ncbi:hypothetical protein SEA_DIZZYRUDY_34 [Microbacterium phage DizzyRudy]|nr:hypothetical protein SEA_DIZZYRUDY_34 [Microbacterium phage DizzyRudy]WMI34471.1 membrane protein [Microbacterium phage Damascus]
MFKKHKLEVRIVKTDDRANVATTSEEPTLNAQDYADITVEAATRLGKKLLIGAVATIAAVAVVTVLANAADTALQNAIVSE